MRCRKKEFKKSNLGRFWSSHALSILSCKLPMMKWTLNAVTNDFATSRDVRSQVLNSGKIIFKVEIRKKKLWFTGQ